MSGLTGTWTELIYASTVAGIAKNTWTTEVGINDTTTMGMQAKVPATFWLNNQNQVGRGFKIVARGVVTSTATPSFTWTIRGGAAANVASTPILLGSAAIPVSSGATGQWRLEGDCILKTVGSGPGGTGNSTLTSLGEIICPAFSGGALQPLFGAATTPGTVATFDPTIDNFINFNVVCSASSASNGITLQQLLVYGLN